MSKKSTVRHDTIHRTDYLNFHLHFRLMGPIKGQSGPNIYASLNLMLDSIIFINRAGIIGFYEENRDGRFWFIVRCNKI